MAVANKLTTKLNKNTSAVVAAKKNSKKVVTNITFLITNSVSKGKRAETTSDSKESES